MHELSVCQALLAEVAAVASRHAATAVTDVHVGMGPLSGVEAGLMREAFPVAAAGTVADGATLHLRRSDVRVRCTACGAETAARANRLLCGACGDWRTTLTAGDELTLERVGMQTEIERTTTGEMAHV